MQSIASLMGISKVCVLACVLAAAGCSVAGGTGYRTTAIPVPIPPGPQLTRIGLDASNSGVVFLVMVQYREDMGDATFALSSGNLKSELIVQSEDLSKNNRCDLDFANIIALKQGLSWSKEHDGEAIPVPLVFKASSFSNLNFVSGAPQVWIVISRVRFGPDADGEWCEKWDAGAATVEDAEALAKPK